MNFNTIKSCLSQLVGFKQVKTKCDVPKIDADLLVSESGLYFDGTEGMNHQEWYDNLQEPKEYNLPTWNAITNYTSGERVIFNGTAYQALQNSTNEQPDIAPLFWEDLGAAITYSSILRDYKEQAVSEVIADLYTMKKMGKDYKDIMKLIYLTRQGGNRTPYTPGLTLPPFVWWRLKLKSEGGMGLALRIHKIRTYFALPQQINLYVYRSENPLPIQTIVLDVTATNAVQEHAVSISLTNEGNWTRDGFFYFVFDTSEFVAGQILYSTSTALGKPCGCTGYDPFYTYKDYLQFDTQGSNDLPNVSNAAGLSNNDLGLNFEMSINCSPEYYICQQKHVFARAIQLKFALNFMQILDSNPYERDNRRAKFSERAKKALTLTIGENGLQEQYKESLKAVNLDFAALDSVCMPCVKKGGISIGIA